MPTSQGASASSGVSQPPLASSSDILGGLRCSPSRRSLKFSAGAHARHFLAFDTSISREERLLLFMELFVFRQLLVEASVVPAFQPATYTPEELLEVRVVTDPRHPAYGQAGLYARCAIPHNTIVTPYSGFIEVFATSCNSRTYTMGFGSIGDDYALDAEFVGNYGRYANDPRGVGTLQPNLSAENRYNSRGESFTALVARRQISAGEEILMSYGKAHRLSATPWLTMQGEPLMRPRVGGVVPFPAFRTKNAAAPSVEGGDASGLKGEAASASSPFQNETRVSMTEVVMAAEGTCAPATGDAGRNIDSTATGSDGASRRQPLVQDSPLPSVANDLLWECTQCGMWTLCEPSAADAPMPCSACGTPKLSGARFVSLLSSPAITQHALLAEAGLDDTNASPRAIDRPLASMSTALTSSTSPSQDAPPASPTFAAGSPCSSTYFSSEHADWPMNVPFLPWQVWDAAVPLSILAKHSRFETQKHMFLYIVDTGLGGEEKKRGRGTAAATAQLKRKERRERAAWKRKGTSTASGWDGEEEEEEEETEEVDDDAVLSPPPPSSIPVRGSRRIGGGGSGRGHGNGARLKRGVLWERQGDVDPEDLALLNSGLSTATPLPLSSSPVSPDLAFPTRGFPSACPSPLRHNTEEVADRVEALPWQADRRGTAAAPLAKSPLSLLLASTQEMDRLIVLRRDGTPTQRRSAAAAPVFSAQIASVRRRLQCMTRRLFTGKTFQPGDIVSYVGGLVRQHGDSRCRVSDSCLEIPLRYFLPPALRKLCSVPTAEEEAVLKACANAAQCNGEGTALHRFCRRVDGFSLVVTNEFMYCPCLVWEDAEGPEEASTEPQADPPEGKGERTDPPHAMDEVECVLLSCNVALVLTLDSLGCPYACAVATKVISAFEPLLARSQ